MEGAIAPFAPSFPTTGSSPTFPTASNLSKSISPFSSFKPKPFTHTLILSKMKLTTVFRTGILGLTTVGAHRDLLPDPHGLAHARDLHQQQHHHRGHPVAVRQIVQVHKQQMDQVQTVVPSSVVFHDTNVTTPTAALHNHTTTDSNGNGTGATGWPYEADNITACTAPNYQDTSPLRTHIIRDDCKDLLKKVLARAGYWEMAQWTGLPSNGTYLGLASEGTCQFAVSRILDEKLVHDQGQGAVYGNATINHNNNASSDVAMYVLFCPLLFVLCAYHQSPIHFANPPPTRQELVSKLT